ncbi:hypothetical protein Bca52824_031174 [Brassica carinata]|uniref:F-box/LRR-repeat protein 15/At3g58940/PEG3-like LRR domain-containing protein n=1 Tax=Brassica carinata TaxID=52824 RepID=A0A8X7SAI3_BRACI|nr:hypothetical protein Bca52824_031174 [Brassica carinata]
MIEVAEGLMAKMYRLNQILEYPDHVAHVFSEAFWKAGVFPNHQRICTLLSKKFPENFTKSQLERIDKFSLDSLQDGAELHLQSLEPWIQEDSDEDDEEGNEKNHHGTSSLSQFVSGTLLLHKAPALETFHLNSCSECSASQIGLWFSFRSLVKLRLLSVVYSDDESFSRLISNCPVLEDLVVETCPQDNVATFTVDLPSLQSLFVGNTVRESPPDDHMFVIHSQSLKRLNIVDYFGELNLIGNFHELLEANLQSMSYHANVLESFSFVRRLRVCLADESFVSVQSVIITHVTVKLVRKHQIFEEFEIATRSAKAYVSLQ